jgi:hypothetical protein
LPCRPTLAWAAGGSAASEADWALGGGLGAPQSTDRPTVALGMPPRGEVGLSVADVGPALAVDGNAGVSPQHYVVIVSLVALTTIMSSPALRWRMPRR